MIILLERFKEGIEVEHSPNDSSDKRNERRQHTIKEHFEKTVTVPKDMLLDYLNEKLPNINVNEKLKNISFENANPRNNHFMNELSFAGESITEGFLDFFTIEREKALKKYLKQLQVIEKVEKGQSQFYAGVFKDGKLLRATKYQDSVEKLYEFINKKNNQIQQKKQQRQEQTRSLERRRDDY